jgi:hypothetical protein
MKQHNEIINELRSKLHDKDQLINLLRDDYMKIRKDLDLEKEEHQLTQLKYEKMKDNLDKLINDKLYSAREAIKEVVDDGNK